VDCEQPKFEPGFTLVTVPDGPHTFRIDVTTQLPVRLFGAAVEREPPSIVVDGMGVGMLNCDTMLRDDPKVYAATFAHRKYDLVVFHLGTLSNPRFYADCQEKILARQRGAIPDVPILIMSPPDLLLHPWLAKVREEQRKFVRDHGLAFFDFFAAMGGAKSFRKFDELGMTWMKDGVH